MVKKVLFVCLGNICRSPLAEALFMQHIQNLNLSAHFLIDSCGTGGWHQGEKADSRMIQTAASHGVSITHLARQIEQEDFSIFDHIFVMDDQNAQDLSALAPKPAAQINKVTSFSKKHLNQNIPDPYFGDMQGFEDVYHLLNSVTFELANYFHQTLKNP